MFGKSKGKKLLDKMKATKFFIIAAAAITFAACSSSSGDDPQQTPDSPSATTTVAATFSADIKAISRASGTSWDANDEIGITAADNSDMEAKYKNVKFTTTGDGSFSSGPVYYQNEESVTFNAYYPYSSAGGTITGSTAADSQTAESQKKIDYLYATATGKKSSPTVTMTFTHRMSQIMLTFKQGDDVDLKDLAGYTISGLKMQGTFNTGDGTAEATGSAEDLAMAVTGESAATFSAPAVILYPQAAVSFDLSVTLGGQTFTQKAIAINDGALKAGNCYQYTIEISKAKLDVKQTSISGWSSVDGGSGMVVFQNE